MDQSHQQRARGLPLGELVTKALIELESLGYSQRSLRRYRVIWQHLIAFSPEGDPNVRDSEDLGARFVEAHRIHDGEAVSPEDRWRRHVVFGVKVLGAFARDGRIERSRTDVEKVGIPPTMKKPLRNFEHYCRDRLHLRPSTLNLRIKEIAIFLAFLRTRDINTLDQLQPVDLAAFVTFRPHLKPRTLSRIISDVRSFLRFLTLRGILHRELTHVLPTIRVPRDATIPSVWDAELVVRLLEVVDRSSPRGKRDYAILLLACRLGLRLGDIRALTLDNLNWEADLIEITQSKTGTPVQLPLTKDVGEALIDYLRSGRPQTNYREVFLKLNPPFAPFGQNTHLHHIVTYWRQLAGIEFRSRQHGGLHSLRHTLATQLLQAETPFHVISEILGHATTASTLIYAKADVEALRGAALDTKQPHESARTQQRRISIIRQFAQFMCRQGYRADVPDRLLGSRRATSFSPRILTHTEVEQLLHAADQLAPTARSPTRHLIMPEVFRLLYGCGFRLSEVLQLRVADVDLERGVLTVRQGKFGKDRLVPPALPLVLRLQRYAARFGGSRPPDAYFFPSHHGGSWSIRTVYRLFRELLLKCGIPHAGRGRGPRVHDVRHTFAVHSPLRWYREGADLDAKLPVLATYLGHQSLVGTQHYLHLTAEFFPEVTVRTNAAFGDVIPRRTAS